MALKPLMAIAVLACLAACDSKAPEKPTAPAASAAAAPAAPAPVTTADIAEFEQRFGADKVLIALKQYFPEDYASVVSTIIAAGKSGGDVAAVQLASAKATQAIRTKYAAVGSQASDATLIKLLTSSLQMHMHVREAQGDMICDAFSREGIVALPDPSFLKTDLDDSAVMTFETLAEGRDHPQPVAAPSDDDLSLVLKDVVAHGVSEKSIADMQDATRPQPTGTACAFAMQFLKSAIALPGEAGHRIRADMAKGVLGLEIYK